MNAQGFCCDFSNFYFLFLDVFHSYSAVFQYFILKYVINVYINIYKQYVKHNINFARYGDGCQDYPEPGNSSGE